MSIRWAVTSARIEEGFRGFYVAHPSNGAVLAYCDTRDEAEAVVAVLDALSAYTRASVDGKHVQQDA